MIAVETSAAAPELAGRARALGDRIVAYLPAAMAFAVILFAGWIADRQSRDLRRQQARSEVQEQLGNLRTDLEREIGEHLQLLNSLAGALSAAPGMSNEAFRDVVATLTASGHPILAIGADPLDGALLLQSTDRDAATQLRDVFAEIPLGESGILMSSRSEEPTLVLWAPVDSLAPNGAAATWGSVAAITGAAQLFKDAAIWEKGLDVALTSDGDDVQSVSRALQYGSAAVLAEDPVTATVVLAGEPWVLAAVPKGGWQATSTHPWMVWILTALAAGLIAGPIAYTGTLSRNGQRTVLQLRQREAQLDQLSRRLGLALEASRVGVWDYNIENGHLAWDHRMHELYGYPDNGEPRRREDWSSRLHPEDVERAQREFRDSIERTGKYESDYRIILTDGTERHIKAMGSVFINPDNTSSILGVNWDVTSDELRSQELVDRRKEAEAASVAKSRFLANMSHEIRTPMNGVIGMLDLLLRGEMAPDQRERAEIAKGSAGHLLSILNDVLDFSKLEADRIELQSEPVDLRNLVQGSVALMSAVARERNLSVQAELSNDIPQTVLIDGTRLRQILLNLIGNAVKFTESGSVTVKVGYDPAAGGVIQCAVIDTGVGIPEAERAKLFQRFNQVDATATRVRSGTGLGLAISRQLVELMGGEISVESEVYVGSTFRFWMPAPVVADVAPNQATDESEPHAPSGPIVTGPSQQILVAEDNATNQLVISSYLKLAGHKASFVNNGAEAIARLQQQEFDLIIMDIRMPVMDGATAAAMIRQLGGPCSQIPIIALTANAMSGDRAAYMEAGMTDYLTKPVAAEALYAAISRASMGYSSSSAQPSEGSNDVIAPATSSVSSPRSAS